jgi:hypothetical protein
MGSGRGYSFDSNVPSHLKAGKMRYEQKSFTVKGAGNASIWRLCAYCHRDFLGFDGLVAHQKKDHAKEVDDDVAAATYPTNPLMGNQADDEPISVRPNEIYTDPDLFGVNSVCRGESTEADDEGQAKARQDFSVEG